MKAILSKKIGKTYVSAILRGLPPSFFKENNKMADRERLLAIKELNLSGKINQLDGGGLNKYAQLLNSFTEDYPEQEEKIKTALEAKDYASLTKYLLAVRDIMEKIHADGLARDCIKHINELDSINHEKLEAYITYLLKSLSILSLDIQMALLQDHNAGQDQPSEKNHLKNDEGSQKGKTILAVDDTAFFLTMLRTILQDVNCRLICVTSGDDALRFLTRHSPNLFLLDIDMPQMDGYELALRIRERGQKAPIVFMTGNSKKEHVVKAIEVGAADFIVKPIKKEDVLSKINKYI
jgi:CheY-like chemotaxis protein